MFYQTRFKKIITERLDLIEDPKVRDIATRWVDLPDEECVLYCSVSKDNLFEAFVLSHNGNIMTSYTFPEFRPTDVETRLLIEILTLRQS